MKKIIIALLSLCVTLGVNAQKKQRFDEELKTLIKSVANTTEKDQRKFDSCMAVVEARISAYDNKPKTVKNAAEVALLHYTASYMYKILGSHYADRRNADKSYRSLGEEHDSKVLVDKVALAKSSADNYSALVSKRKDGAYFDHDLLHALVGIVDYNDNRKMPLYQEMVALYDSLGREKAVKWLKDEIAYMNMDKSFSKKDSAIYYWREVVKANPTSHRINDYKNTLGEFLVPIIEIHICSPFSQNGHYQEIFANQPFTVKTEYWGVDKASLTIRKYDGEVKGKERWRKTYKETGAIIRTEKFTYGADAENKNRIKADLPIYGVDSMQMTLPAGDYLFVSQYGGNKEYAHIKITSMKLICTREGDKVRCIVVDAVSGKPMPGIKVQRSKVEYDNGSKKNTLVATMTTDKEGVALFASSAGEYVYKAIKSADDIATYSMNHFDASSSKNKEEKNSTKIEMFTDRGIYRPGQTVHVTGVVYNDNNRNEFLALEGKKVRAIVRYITSGRMRDTIDVVTNAYGSFDFSYKLPDDARLGYWYVMINDYRLMIIVEEYKRPTWQLTLAATDNGGVSPTFGDEVTVKGTAKMFSGAPVGGGKVLYEVQRQKVNCWRWGGHSDYINYTTSTTVADDGTFDIKFVLKPFDDEDSFYPFTKYTVTAKVTDLAGETHEQSYSFTISKNEFNLGIKNESVIDLSHATPIALTAVDAMGNEREVKVAYKLVLGKDTISSGEVMTGKEYQLKDFCNVSASALSMGDYTLCISATDKNGRLITAKGSVSAFDSDVAAQAKRKAVFIKDFYYVRTAEDVESNTITKDKGARIFFAPAQDSTYIYTYIYDDSGNVVGKSLKCCGKSICTYDVNYNEKCGDAQTFSLFYVKNGVLVEKSQILNQQVISKKFTFTWKTFRDKMQPGSKETWTFSVLNPDGTKAKNVEVAATMYDASLDVLTRYNHNWNLSLCYNRFSFYSWLGGSRNEFKGELGFYGDNKPLSCSSYLFDVIDLDEMMGNNLYYSVQSDMGLMSSASRMKNARTMMATAPKRSAATLQDCVMAGPNVEETDEGDASPDREGATRTNFAETAFFYPHIMTDEKGEGEIRFTLPESLTKWKFLALVHDKSMNYANVEAEVVAQKLFMVQPNMPRFVRVGDEATVTSRIINQSDKDISGKAIMRLLRAKDESLISTQSVDFSVKAGKTTSVSFPLTATSCEDDIICEIVAEGSDGTKVQEIKGSNGKGSKTSNGKVSQLSTLNSQLFSDGERHLIPVLPSRVVVTESVPFYIEKGEDNNVDNIYVHHVDISGLFNGNSKTAADKTMNIEYTANPVWTVVEALRDIDTPTSQCATSLAASVYANSKLLSLADAFSAYTDKQIVNRDSVSLKFQKAMNSLRTLQNKDGGFSWFPGFKHSSYYISLMVAENLFKVQSGKGGLDSSLSGIHSSLIHYLDSMAVERYEYNKAHKIKNIPSETEYHYLALCSLTPGRKVSSRVKAMQNEYLKYMENNAKQMSIYGISMSANILRAYGRKSAEKFTDIVRSYLVEDKGQGKHFESKRAQYSWRDYRIPTQVAAMNAIYASNPQDANLKDMQLWLLRQKQVQSWDNPVNTVEVADLLLKVQEFKGSKVQNGNKPEGDSSLITHHSSLPKMALNGTTLTDKSFSKDNVKADSLFFAEEMGYMNKQVNLALIGNSANSLSIISSPRGGKGGGFSWGAVTVTFSEDAERLKSYSTGEIKISRRLMVEKNGKWVDADKDATFEVGQKVRVRHTLTTDRDMDYVCVKTLHPSCFEPTETLSGYCWKGGAGCYQSIHDSYTELFFESFREGTSTLDIDYFVTRLGTYNMGITSAECTYAPMFGGHSGGSRVVVAP